MNQRNKSILVILMIVPLLMFMSDAEESHGSATKDFLGKLLNFVLLFGGLAYLLRKPMGQFLKGRSVSIEKELKEAKESREEASGRLASVEARLSALDQDVEKLRLEAEEEGRTLHERIIEEARQDAERLKQFARQEIDSLTQAAVRDIKEFAAALATDLARQRIQDQMTGKDQTSMIEKSIERLEKLHEKSNSDTKIRSRTH